MEYLDLDLEIEPEGGRDYRVAARSSAGEAHSIMCFPFDELALKEHLHALRMSLLRSIGHHRRILTPEAQSVQDFGRQLFDALIAGDVRAWYELSRSNAEKQRKGTRLKLHIKEAPELASLPWEYLYDKRADEYLCLSHLTPLVRYLDLPRAVQPLKVTPPLRILGVIASPNDLPLLDTHREQQRVQTALEQLQASGSIELTWLEKQTWQDLRRAMQDSSWHIIHFIGHGGFNERTQEGVLALTDEQGKAHLLTATQVGNLMAGHRTLRLVLLNACDGAHSSQLDDFSSTAATLARRGIPAVIAMQEEITDGAAIQFTTTFYEQLARGMSVDAAVAEARTAIHMGKSESLEWGIPVLYMRASDGKLFTLRRKTVDPKRALPLQSPLETPTAESSPAIPQQGQHAKTSSSIEKPRPIVDRSFEAMREEYAAVMRQQVTDIEAIRRLTIQFTAVATNPHLSDKSPYDAMAGAFFLRRRLNRIELTQPAGTLLYTYAAHHADVASVSWSRDGRYIASGGADDKVHIWDALTGQPLLIYGGHSSLVHALAWSPDGTRIASTGYDRSVQIWRALTGEKLATGLVPSGGFGALAWSPDGSYVVTADFENAVQVWDSSEGTRLIHYHGHKEGAAGVVWSPDGDNIASGGLEGTVQIWNALKGDLLTTFTGHTDRVFALAWPPDIRRIASASDDGTVQIWDLTTATKLLTYQHSAAVFSVAWSPDGTQIASAGQDGIIHFWESFTGRKLYLCQGHSAFANQVVWSPDGQRLASASEDGTIKIWRAGQ